MGLRDYIICEVCLRKLIYDGDDRVRDGLERDYGDPDAPTWTVKAFCPEHSGDGSIKLVPLIRDQL